MSLNKHTPAPYPRQGKTRGSASRRSGGCGCKVCQPCKGERLDAISMAIEIDVTDTGEVRLDMAQLQRWGTKFAASEEEIRQASDGALDYKLLTIHAEGSAVANAGELTLAPYEWIQDNEEGGDA